MKLNAVGVAFSDLAKTVAFYSALGFKFPNFSPDEDHLEPLDLEGSTRLMLDSKKLLTDLLSVEPKPATHSHFAIEYDTPEELNQIVATLTSLNYKILKEPWDAFWGQRYAVVEDPDGYKVDLYARITTK